MWKLFKDKNDINEKNVVGFAIIDLTTALMFIAYEGGGQLEINDTIYNSFVMVTLGCFGISAFEKIKKN